MTAMTAELAADADISGQAGHRFACAAGRDSEQVSIPAATPDRRAVRSWQLLVLAAPAVVAVWSGWVGIGRMTGFGIVHPLAAIWDSLRIDSAVTLPVGVEAYAAYALRTWLTRSQQVSRRTRRFAGWSAAASLLLGMAGQVAYHVLAQAGATRAPGGITTAVSYIVGPRPGNGLPWRTCHAPTHAPPARRIPSRNTIRTVIRSASSAG